MKGFIEYVVKRLVDQPEAVSVTSLEKNGLTVYELRVDPADAGKVIGRKGSTIQALRSLLQVGAMKQGKRCTLELVEEDDGL